MNSVLFVCLAFLAVSQAQFLNLQQNQLLKGLLPSDIQKLLSQLNDKQKELLLKADVNHNLGANSIIAANRLLDSYEKLPAKGQAYVKKVLVALNGVNKENAKVVVKGLVEEYDLLDAETKSAARLHFSQPIKSLESNELRNFVGAKLLTSKP